MEFTLPHVRRLMPLIKIKSLPLGNDIAIDKVMVNLSSSISDEFHLSLKDISITWEELHYYISGGVVRGVQPQSTHPPLVSLTLFEVHDSDLIEKMMLLIGAHLEKEFKLPQNIFIEFQTAKSGMVYDQGEILRM
jgi:hypothetical protein